METFALENANDNRFNVWTSKKLDLATGVNYYNTNAIEEYNLERLETTKQNIIKKDLFLFLWWTIWKRIYNNKNKQNHQEINKISNDIVLNSLLIGILSLGIIVTSNNLIKNFNLIDLIVKLTHILFITGLNQKVYIIWVI